MNLGRNIVDLPNLEKYYKAVMKNGGYLRLTLLQKSFKGA